MRGRPVCAGATIDRHEPGELRVALGDAEDDERAVIEVELDGHPRGAG